MGIELNSLIRVFDDGLPEAVCEALITLYEHCSEGHERIDQAKRPTFTQFNLTDHHEHDAEARRLHEVVVSRVLGLKKAYYDFVDPRCFPADNGLEKIRIKKYRNDGEDLFDTHVDVRNLDTAGRFLAYIFYLNDVAEGGETVFLTGASVKPQRGRVVLFPPLWMFPHQGRPPVSNPKYIMSTYLLYR